MQTVSQDIRTRRSTARPALSPDIKAAFHGVFVARQTLTATLAAQILSEGEPEQWADSTPVCRHFRHRHAKVGVGAGEERATAQVHTHEAGIVIRFWVFGPSFAEVRVRDLILLRLPAGEKGYEVWLDDGEKVFPHEGGKYEDAGRVILQAMRNGR